MNSSFNSFIIRDLKPSTLYKVHIMASTVGGSTNGTSLTLVTMVLGEARPRGTLGTLEGCEGTQRSQVLPQTCPITVPPSLQGALLAVTPSPACFPDDIEIQILFLTLGLIFVLLIVLLICFQKNGR